MAVEVVRSRWYFALCTEDCVQLKYLLEAHPHLVVEGWKADLTRGMLGEAGAGTAERHWFGRSALHAAARRGYAELVETIVNLYSDNEGEWLCAEPTSDLAEGVTRSLADLLALKDGQANLEAVAMAVINGNSHVTKVLLDASVKCKSNPYQVDTSWWAEKQISRRENSRQGSLRRLTEQVRRITEETMESLNEDERRIIEVEYSQHPKFKHLPLEEYLFYFAFSNNNIDIYLLKTVQNEMWKRALLTTSYSIQLSLLRRETIETRAASDEDLSIIQTRGGASSTEIGTKGDVRTVLRSLTEETMSSLESEEELHIKVVYSQNSDFNFLPIEEYLFAFTFTPDSCLGFDKATGRLPMHATVRKKLWERIACHPEFAEIRQFFMLELRDGQGRTALHVAVDHDSVDELLELVKNTAPELTEQEQEVWMNTLDSGGRTPLFRAVATSRYDSLEALLGESRVNLNATFRFFESDNFFKSSDVRFLSELSSRNGFHEVFMWNNPVTTRAMSIRAIEVAVLHGNHHCVKLLLNDTNKNRPENCRLDLNHSYHHLLEDIDDYAKSEIKKYAPLALAVTIGDAEITRLLLEDPRACDRGRPSKWLRKLKHSNDGKFHGLKFPALHIAAAVGKFDLVKVFLENSKGIDELYDPFVRDEDGNTAMHHVTQGKFNLVRHQLLHFASVDQIEVLHKVQAATLENGEQDEKKGLIERQGCVQLLLQAGLNVWTTNKMEEAPYPNSKATSDFLSWWYDKLAKETVDEQNTLNAAANAISVTAALVATASYVGPLQPPLGYEVSVDGLPSDIQVHLKWVKLFFVFNTLSFYLAVSSIMLAIIPTLPIPRQKVRMEIKYTRRTVIFAVGALFPSIVSVILAFVSSSMAVVSNASQGVKLSTVIVGGLVCLLVIYIFFIRLLGLVFHGNAKITSLYGNSIFLDKFIPMKWQESTIGKKW